MLTTSPVKAGAERGPYIASSSRAAP